MSTSTLANTPETIAAAMDGQLRPLAEGRHVAVLPSPCVQNHAAFLERDAHGTLSCAWFAGGLEGKADICIYRSVFDPHRARWRSPERLSDDPERSEQNPILFYPAEGRALLVHTAQPGGDQDRCIVRLREIGQPPRPLDLPGGTFVRGALHVRPDGAWLLPVFHCTPTPNARWTGRHDTASLAISHDQGQRWHLIPVPDSLGCVHMSLVSAADGCYIAFFRRRQADWVYRAESHDGGETWTSPTPTDVPNNNSSIGVRRLLDGRVALVCNPVNAAMHDARRASLYDELGDDTRPEAHGGCTPIWGVPRAPLTLALSDDEGHHFAERLVIADGPGTCLSNNSEDGKNHELSYPSLSQAPSGEIDIAFSLHRRAIAHVRLAAPPRS